MWCVASRGASVGGLRGRAGRMRGRGCAQRNWGEFFSSFKAPEADYQKLEKRVAANLLHFAGNYVVAGALVAVLHGLTQAPGFLLWAVLGAVVAAVLMRPPKTLKPQLRKLQLESDGKRALAALAAAAGVLVLSGNALSVLYVGATAGLLILAHAALRSQSLSATISSWTTQRRYEVERVAQDMDQPAAPQPAHTLGTSAEEVERAEAGAGGAGGASDAAGGAGGEPVEHTIPDSDPHVMMAYGAGSHSGLQQHHGSAGAGFAPPGPALGDSAPPATLGNVDPSTLPRPRARGKKSD
jgi:hypothetical protein